MESKEIEEVINATFASREEFAATLALLNKQSKLRQIELQIDALNAKRNEALAPIENARIELENQRREIVDELKAAT